jgi:plasmid stabilization system protein ParE
MTKGPWTPAWVLVNVYGFLIVAVLSIYFLCVVSLGGELALTWCEPHVLGLSLYTIASLVNGMLLALVFVTLLGADPSRRASVVTGVTALLVTAGVQVTLNGWKRAAERDVESVLARGEAAAEQVARMESELASLAAHPWAGRYRGEWDGGVVRYWFAPASGFVYSWLGTEYSDDASDATRAFHSSSSYGPVVAEDNGFRIERAVGFGGLEFYAVSWGERRYLVTPAAVQRFWDDASKGPDVPLDYRIVLREGDEMKPVTGLPELPPELAALVR